ncbi:hypothetical protein [Lacrimispora sp.]|uniref:hypothetical protein n=1 Tax=Lacrimispora sp. TaxID=2719234 RepID=UPI0028A7EC53|nr:hypothetical protein [Lacrimispora sp.]
MIELILFALFLTVGLGVLIAGIVYMRKEKHDPESVMLYRIISIIGAVLTAGSVLFRLFV